MIIQTEQNLNYKSAVTLEQYSWLIGYDECSMFGVYNPTAFVEDECRSIWTQRQRNYILRYFQEAQEELENETGRLFSPTWITGNLADTGNNRLTDIQTCKISYYTKWNNLIQMGRKTAHTIASSVVIDYSTDPVLIGPIAVNTSIVTDINFIKIFYPDTEIEINPSNVYFSGTDIYIEIPKCRLVKYELRDNPSSGILYTNDANFQETVDIKYFYTTDLNSIVEFGDGTAGLYYLAGEVIPTVQQIDMIIRLAHSKMPDEPCGCDISQRLWKRDRNIPELLTAERLQCPFGINDGAWIAYKWAQSMKKLRIGHG